MGSAGSAHVEAVTMIIPTVSSPLAVRRKGGLSMRDGRGEWREPSPQGFEIQLRWLWRLHVSLDMRLPISGQFALRGKIHSSAEME